MPSSENETTTESTQSTNKPESNATQKPALEKPRARALQPTITRLPRLTWGRRRTRRLLGLIARVVVGICTRCEIQGLENIPLQGPALIVFNHIGDADIVVGMAFLPPSIDSLSKSELRDFPVLGWIMEAYGVIWVHRGLPDRRALQMAIQGLREGRILAIAPEGRESLTGALEEGTGGAAYLALKTHVPIIPITITGTENQRIYGNLKHFRRSSISVTIGPTFYLEAIPNRREAIRQGTQTIMYKLSQQLPLEYRGVYQTGLE